MKLAWITDAHLNFLPRHVDLENEAKIIPWKADAILIGGDTAEASDLSFWLMRIADTFKKPVYFVLGNHDYYGSGIRKVRDEMRNLCDEYKLLNWLPEMGAIALTKTTAIVGVGGWGDARFGQWENTTVKLNDYVRIQDLAEIKRHEHLGIKLNQLGDEEAQTLKFALTSALQSFKRVIVLTHVPPFLESTWHLGENSDWNFAPHFGCKATGDVLLKLATSHPDQTIHVLCGHSHSPGMFWARPNLLVTTGGADYGHPVAQPPILVP